jgi:glycosyltransferase involved in cell wall biosynthesis
MTKTPPQITLAIPFHSNLDYLKKTIESVRMQSIESWLLVVSDDSPVSKPEVSQATQSYLQALGDPRIQYSRYLESTGMASNWNRCLTLGQTDLVTVLHADDELAPQYCERMIEAATQYAEPVAFFCAARVIDGQSRPVFSFPDWYKTFLLSGSGALLRIFQEKGITRLLKGNIIFCPTLCFRKSGLGEERFRDDLKMVTDLEMILRLLLKGEQLLGLMDQPLYLYRRHDSNATVVHTQSLLRFREEDALYRSVEKTLVERGWNEAAALARKRTIIQLNLLYCMAKDLLAFQFAGFTNKLKFLIQVRKR